MRFYWLIYGNREKTRERVVRGSNHTKRGKERESETTKEKKRERESYQS